MAARSKKTNLARRFDGRGPRPDNLKHKRTEAAERAEAWSALSVLEKIASLDARFGAGQGAQKQRAKLAKTVKPTVEPKASAKAEDKA
jgi:hypothetical protein